MSAPTAPNRRSLINRRYDYHGNSCTFIFLFIIIFRLCYFYLPQRNPYCLCTCAYCYWNRDIHVSCRNFEFYADGCTDHLSHWSPACLYTKNISQIKSPPRGHLAVLGFFLLLVFLLALRLSNAKVSHYDNFTHWLLVVRDILNNHRLPNFQSDLIAYQGYPTGSACFIYYVCQIIGDTEGSMLIGQMILLVSCLTVLWTPVQRINPVNSISISVLSCFLLVSNTLITDLLVDSLIAYLGIAQFAILLYYKNDLRKAGICSSIIGAFLISVKNSGIFFVGLHCLLPLFLVPDWKKHLKANLLSKKYLSFLGTHLIPPAILYYLWYRHVKLVFLYGAVTKHSMTPQNYLLTLRGKSFGMLLDTVSTFVQHIFTPGIETFFSLCLLLLVAFSFYASCKTKPVPVPSRKWIIGWSLASYICYLLGLLGMYLFSMPHGEAIQLAGYHRYILPMFQYLAGITLISLLPTLERPLRWTDRFFPALLCLFLLPVLGNISTLFYSPATPYSDTRNNLIQLKSEYQLPEGARYMIVGPSESGFLYHLASYELWSEDIVVSENPTTTEYPHLLNDFDYLILMPGCDNAENFLHTLNLPLGQPVYCLTDFQ